MSNIERIKEVLNLEAYYKKQKTEFRKRIISTVLAIGLIIGALTFRYYYG